MRWHRLACQFYVGSAGGVIPARLSETLISSRPSVTNDMAQADPITSIPAHASTVDLLQRLKRPKESWDTFLLSLFEEELPPETVAELDRRRKHDRFSSYAEAERRHPKWKSGH